MNNNKSGFVASLWSDPETARLYNAFAQICALYKVTSVECVDIVQPIGDTVLDLAGGVGTTLRQILDILPPNGRVFSVDASPEMQNFARQNVIDSRVRFVICAAEQLGQSIESSSIDTAICNAAAWQFSQQAFAVAVTSVLKPKGVLGITVPSEFMPCTATCDLLAELARRLGRVSTNSQTTAPVRRQSIIDSLSYALAEQGLHQSRQKMFSFRMTAREIGLFFSMPAMYKSMGLKVESSAQVREEIDSILQNGMNNPDFHSNWVALRYVKTT